MTEPLEQAVDVGRVGALGAWRMTKGLYRLDPDLMDALWTTRVLEHLPEWCLYVETPGRGRECSGGVLSLDKLPDIGYDPYVPVGRRRTGGREARRRPEKPTASHPESFAPVRVVRGEEQMMAWVARWDARHRAAPLPRNHPGEKRDCHYATHVTPPQVLAAWG